MHKNLIILAVSSAIIAPSMASAQQSCERQRSNRVAATVGGVAAGGVAGNVIAGRGDKTLGTVIGAVIGGVVGNQVAKPNADCSHAYGFYDQNNRWHATGINSTQATGYFDRNGDWANGTPNGYYTEDNRWVQNAGPSADNGYMSAEGHWVPASANGYFDRNDMWIAGTSAGYYNERGRWVAGNTTGHYDRNGRWVAGVANGNRDANGNWVSAPVNGYYGNDSRWQAGMATGYYDTRGRWIATSAVNRGPVNGMPREARARAVWLDSYIRSARAEGSLNRTETNRAMRDLNNIRRSERSMRRDRDGELSIRDEAALNVRLDRLSGQLRITTLEGVRAY